MWQNAWGNPLPIKMTHGFFSEWAIFMLLARKTPASFGPGNDGSSLLNIFFRLACFRQALFLFNENGLSLQPICFIINRR
jgi:hypothetical protein